MQLQLHTCSFGRRTWNRPHPSFQIPNRILQLVPPRFESAPGCPSLLIRKRCPPPEALKSQHKVLEIGDGAKKTREAAIVAVDETRVVAKGDRQRGILLLNLLVSDDGFNFVDAHQVSSQRSTTRSSDSWKWFLSNMSLWARVISLLREAIYYHAGHLVLHILCLARGGCNDGDESSDSISPCRCSSAESIG